MLKFSVILMVLVCTLNSFAQKTGASIVDIQPDGRYTLSESGASYFAQLSLDCTNKPVPHYYYNILRQPGDTQTPKDLWPAFYGCMIGTVQCTIIGL